MNVQFLNEQHKSRFELAQASMPVMQRADRSKLAFVFLITGDRKLRKKISPYISLKDGRFLWPDTLMDRDLTNGDDALLTLALQFLSDVKATAPIHLMDELTDDQLRLALNAIIVRRTGIQCSPNKEKTDERYYYYI
ncbi:hypothetical protein NLX67_14630 [Domibacillus sp. A3M-37]|uniref:hypothetical protein n=1 Tax=Domibacillus TaxID=1433999 RepID=UPI000617D0FA|nr:MULTISPECIES: hypothetical protein [Domibacillus]MCP3763613.1 hypothetical protein [Domibacillus sp. A3M-37]